jgi:hypothetical protein
LMSFQEHNSYLYLPGMTARRSGELYSLFSAGYCRCVSLVSVCFNARRSVLSSLLVFPL